MMSMAGIKGVALIISGKIKKLYSTSRVIKSANFYRLSNLRIGLVKQFLLFPLNHKFWFGCSLILIAFIIFIIEAIYRGYFLTSSNIAQDSAKNVLSMNEHSSVSPTTSQPTSNPTPSGNLSPTDSAVLGASDNLASSDTAGYTSSYAIPTSPPAVSPYPTSVPITATAHASSSSNNNSGNSNCTTSAGVPNSWYSDVYPASPISTSNGSVTLTVAIRDCNKNNISSSSTLKISLNSGDSSTQINGNNLPYTINTQNGQASFTVTSQNNATDNFVIQDTTDSFTVTDTNNNNPTVTFSVTSPGSSSSGGSSTLVTPTTAPTQSVSPTQSITSAPTVVQDLTPTPIPTH